MKKRFLSAAMALTLSVSTMTANNVYAVPSIQEMMVDNFIANIGGTDVVDKQYIEASDVYLLTLKSDVVCEGQVGLSCANVILDFDGHYIHGDGLNISSDANVTFTDGGGIIAEDRTDSADHEAILSRGAKINFIVDKTTPHQPNANVAKGVPEMKAMGNAHAIQCTKMTGGTTDIYVENAYLYSNQQSGLQFDGGNIEIVDITVETDYRDGMHIMLPDENQKAVIHNANVKTDLDCSNPYAPAAIDVANYNGVPHLGKVIINGGTFQGGYEGIVNINGNLEINGGTFIGGDDALVSQAGGNTTVNGGTFKGGVCGAVAYDASLKVKGGTFIGTGDDSMGIAVCKGDLEVSPSSIVTTEGKFGIGEYPIPPEGNSSVVVKGGNITGKVNGINLHNANVEIYGGNIIGQSGHSIALKGLAGVKAAIYDADVNTVELVLPGDYDSLLAGNSLIAGGKFVTTQTGGFVESDKDNCIWKQDAQSLEVVCISSVNASAHGMNIMWKKIPYATEYRVYRVDADKTVLAGTTKEISFLDNMANINGQKYTYYVMAINNNGMSTKATQMSGYFLSTPGITSLENTSKGITVNWQRNTKAKGYYIYRSKNGGSYTKVATINRNNIVKYTDTSAKTNGAKYQYKVLAYSSNGKSDYSSVKTTYFLSRPGFSKVSNKSGTKLSLAWRRNTKASGYQVKYITGKASRIVTIKKNNILKYTTPKLKKKNTYKVYIRSYKTVYGKKYYSSWSLVKSKKIS